jgi:type I restriction enzyme S subunit
MDSLFFKTFGNPFSSDRFKQKKIFEITNLVSYGFTRPMPHKKEGIPIITSKNVTSGKIDFANVDYTDEKSFSELSKKDCPEIWDILYTKDGRIGEAALVMHHKRFCISQAVAILKPNKSS